jgi:hypothetical protein
MSRQLEPTPLLPDIDRYDPPAPAGSPARTNFADGADPT